MENQYHLGQTDEKNQIYIMKTKNLLNSSKVLLLA